MFNTDGSFGSITKHFDSLDLLSGDFFFGIYELPLVKMIFWTDLSENSILAHQRNWESGTLTQMSKGWESTSALINRTIWTFTLYRVLQGENNNERVPISTDGLLYEVIGDGFFILPFNDEEGLTNEVVVVLVPMIQVSSPNQAT